MSEADKKAAALKALDFVEGGMRLGIGTGSTADFFTRALGERVRGGLDIRAVATSDRTAALATQCGVRLADLGEVHALDLTVDGADEIDDELRLIKGGGGALLREKIVAQASQRMIVIADETKLVDALGAFPLPVEVIPFGWEVTADQIARGAKRFSVRNHAVTLRRDPGGTPAVTDGGHYIADCAFERIGDPEGLAMFLNGLPGVVENGLFIGLADMAIVGRGGSAEVIE